MIEFSAFRRSLRFAALASLFAASAAFATPAFARSHHAARHVVHQRQASHAFTRHAGRHLRHQWRLARVPRREQRVVRLQPRGYSSARPVARAGGSAGWIAMSGSGASNVVATARRYIGGNPTGHGSLWCARFMNMVLQQSGYHGTGSNFARSFASYGRRVSGPQVGAIAVMGRGGGGHVGIVSGIDARGNPIVISGNNGNRVREAPISRGRIYAYVMPN
jgi:uncharacterized protein (TIGR02594 family)